MHAFQEASLLSHVLRGKAPPKDFVAGLDKDAELYEGFDTNLKSILDNFIHLGDPVILVASGKLVAALAGVNEQPASEGLLRQFALDRSSGFESFSQATGAEAEPPPALQVPANGASADDLECAAAPTRQSSHLRPGPLQQHSVL